MPKRTGIYGPDRFNFLLALMGFLIHHDKEHISVEEIAAHFNLTKKEIESAVEALLRSGINEYMPYEVFQIDDDLWQEERMLRLTFNPGVDDVPKISGRQLAALRAGLKALKSVPGFAEQEEVDALIEILKKGTTSGHTHEPIVFVPGTLDADAHIIRQAIASSQRIKCEYLNAQGERSIRDLDPLMLFSQDEVWYLWAYCPLRESVRSFRLDRMHNASILDEPVSEAAKAAEIPEYVYVPSEADTRVTLRVLPEASRLITEFRPSEEPKPVGDGWVEFDVMIGDLQILGKVIAHYGGKAKVMQPEAAREVVRDYALKALGEKTLSGFAQGPRSYEE